MRRWARRILVGSCVALIVAIGTGPPPVVLVGASLRGFSVRLFASEYPGRAAGLVLVDATTRTGSLTCPGFGGLCDFCPRRVLRVSRVSFGLPPNALLPSARPIPRGTRVSFGWHQAPANEVQAGTCL
jgi:pimeloyl-ACP methyl ester carboxylesterase